MLVNLVGNAMKFTERGEVVVSVDLDGEAAEGGATLAFAVRDTGIGIPADRREAVFRAFEQADGSTTRRYGGTGLGLTISARLVALMGGRIWVEEAPGGGSLFRFTARFGRVEGAEAAPAAPASFGGLPALVVVGNETGRAIVAEMLAGWRMEPTAVADAGSAAAACRAARDGGRPFAVAVVDGEPLARALADAGAPIVLLSAGVADDCEAGGLVPSVAARLTKPVRQSELFNVLATLLGDGRLPAPDLGIAAAAGSGPSARPLRVLLVEDHPLNQVVATHMLERLGHGAVVASDGRQALAAMESGRFDVVLMDLQMPVMDGFEAAAALRAREAEAGRHTPVIALTAHAMKGDRERCLASGFDGYLPKPIRRAELVAALESLGTLAPAVP